VPPDDPRKTKEKDMTTANSKAIDQAAQIRKHMDDHAKAIRAKDINGSMSIYAPDILSFDVVNPLQKIGLDACRKRTEEWFSSFQGPIGYENSDLSITTGDDVAFCHSLNQVNGTKTDGNQIEMWWRATVCFRKIDNKWVITHEHASVPFDVESGKASLDLKP
jgi:ketosteroid isomerase-like protein